MGQGATCPRPSECPNVAAVALANKLARICWAVLRGERHFAAKGAPLAA